MKRSKSSKNQSNKRPRRSLRIGQQQFGPFWTENTNDNLNNFLKHVLVHIPIHPFLPKNTYKSQYVRPSCPIITSKSEYFIGICRCWICIFSYTRTVDTTQLLISLDTKSNKIHQLLPMQVYNTVNLDHKDLVHDYIRFCCVNFLQFDSAVSTTDFLLVRWLAYLGLHGLLLMLMWVYTNVNVHPYVLTKPEIVPMHL